MIAALTTLQAEIRNAGFECSLSFGRSIATDLTKENIAQGRVVLFFPSLDVESEQMTWQGSPLINVAGSITAFAKTDIDAVQLLHAALVALGFKRENGDVGRPPRMPIDFSLGVVRILWLNCPGGVAGAAQQAGDVWACEQNLEMAFYVP